MLRKLLSLGNDAVGQRVGVLGLLARSAALRAIQPGRFCLSSGFHAPDESADVNFFSAVRAVHARENKPNSCLWKHQFKVAHYRYFHWLWNEGKKDEHGDPVADYIRRNLNALSKEYPDGIWT